jgi:hypothetical protein
MSPSCLATSGKRDQETAGDCMGAVVEALSLEYLLSVFRFNRSVPEIA